MWNDKVKRMLKSELIKKGVSTEDLVTLLNEIGISETKSSIDSKISRGTFSASFFIQCLYVIGCNKIEIDEFRSIIKFTESSNLMAAESTIEYKMNNDE